MTVQSGRPAGSLTIHMNDTPTTMLYSADALNGFNGNSSRTLPTGRQSVHRLVGWKRKISA